VRQVKSYFFISVDGVVESPTSGHFPQFDDEMGAAVGAGFGTADALLMGGVLYDEWAAYWPEPRYPLTPAGRHMFGYPIDVTATNCAHNSDNAYAVAMGLDLFAGIHVRDYNAAKSWYERLLGREPTFIAHATEAVWELAEHRYLFIEEDRDAPGGADITIFVDDLDKLAADIAARGIEPAERVTYSNGVRKAVYRDADGNEIGFGGAPVEQQAESHTS
jgi:predicted enzyme related to lactoylglutathione lyase